MSKDELLLSTYVLFIDKKVSTQRNSKTTEKAAASRIKTGWRNLSKFLP